MKGPSRISSLVPIGRQHLILKKNQVRLFFLHARCPCVADSLIRCPLPEYCDQISDDNCGRRLSFPRPLVEGNDALNTSFQQVVAAKQPGDASAWWNHNGSAEASDMVVLEKKLFAGKLPKASLADADQACGQSGSVVMLLEVEFQLPVKESRTLIVKTSTEYPATECDFYLKNSLHNTIPEVFVDVFAVEGDNNRGFTIVMEKFGSSFPGKPRMAGYSPSEMLEQQLPPVITTLARFHAAFWNDPRLAPEYVHTSADHSGEPKKECSTSYGNFLSKRVNWLKNPAGLAVKDYEWLTDFAVANIMKGLGADGISLVGAKVRFKLLRSQFPSDNFNTEFPLTSSDSKSTCSYKLLWDLANQLRDMHGLPIEIGGIIKPNQKTKTFFERATILL